MPTITRTNRPARWLAAGATAAVSSLTLFSGVAAAGGPPMPDLPVNDSIPQIFVNDVAKAEGTGGMTQFIFTISLSQSSSKEVSVKVTPKAGTAKQDADWQAVPQILGFAPGLTTRYYTVNVVGDDVAEAAETFTVNLSNIQGAYAGDVTGLGTIKNDDQPKDKGLPPIDPQGPDELDNPKGGIDPQGPGGFDGPKGGGAVDPDDIDGDNSTNGSQGGTDGAGEGGQDVAPAATDEVTAGTVRDGKDGHAPHRSAPDAEDGDTAGRGEPEPGDHDGTPVALAGAGALGTLALLATRLRRRRRDQREQER